MKYRLTAGDIIFKIVIYFIVGFAAIVTIYPFVYIISCSFSHPLAIARGEVVLWPKELYFESYKMVFADISIWRSYYNTIWYTVVGTMLNIVFTLLAAYPLSRKTFFARKFFMFIFVFTMFFSGGIIPLFILIVKLGLFNTRWAIVSPILISTWNMIICRTFIQSTIPEELL